MLSPSRFGVLGLALVMATVCWLMADDRKSEKDRRGEVMALYSRNNFKEAYDGLRGLVLDPSCDPGEVCNDFSSAITCLQKLERADEIDELRTGVVEAHK